VTRARAGSGVFAAAVVVLTRASAERLAVTAAIGVLAVAWTLLVAGLRRPVLVSGAVALLGGEYAVAIGGRGSQIDPLAPLVALLLYATFEATTAWTPDRPVRVEVGAAHHSVNVMLRVGVAAWMAALAVMAGVVLAPSGGTGMRVSGAAAACLAAVLLAALARRACRHQDAEAT
jgi:hypothetical protein